MSREDLQFMKNVTQSTKMVEGHYCIGLPLKNNKVHMPNNHILAEQRALNIKKRLLNNPSFRQDYTKFMAKHRSAGG